MQNLRVIFETDGYCFAGVIIAEHINDDTRTLIEVDDEYADSDGNRLYWVNNGYLYPEDECFEEEF